MKLLLLLIGLVVGFGGGVYWGVHNPIDAAKLADVEKRKLLELRLQAAEAARATLDKIIAKDKNASKKPDPDTVALRNEQDRQIKELRRQIAETEQAPAEPR